MAGIKRVKVAVIGAGVAGICAGVQLKRTIGDDFLILEKAADVGGTWRENIYPGVECDVPSHLYSYSFELNPNWSREYPSGGEILGYLRGVVEKYRLRDHLQCDAHVLTARFQDGSWTLDLASGEQIEAEFVISALGILHVPKYPSWPGLDTFRGHAFHTARWPEGLDLTGKRVGIVGTGATTVQLGPKMAEIAEHLSIFQRSPVWVAPKDNPSIPPEEQARLDRDFGALRTKRWGLWQIWEATGLEMVTPEARLNRKSQAAALAHLKSQVNDPAIAAKLIPDYNFTCKRPTFSNDYFPMFNRPNVDLVTEGIDHVEPDGLVLTDGRKVDLDALIYATGFKACDISAELEFFGEDGVALRDVWADRITSYRSVMAPKMPNLFILFGPNSAGLTSAYQMIEAGCEFAVDTIRYMEREGKKSIVPTTEAVEAFCMEIQKRFARTTINKGCASWWTDANGYTHASWPSSSLEYRMMLHKFVPADFEMASA
ncbi:MAG: flavin-containing monooxygenase [Sphingobium sp.]